MIDIILLCQHRRLGLKVIKSSLVVFHEKFSTIWVSIDEHIVNVTLGKRLTETVTKLIRKRKPGMG